MREARRGEIHDQREGLLRARAYNQHHGSWIDPVCVDQGVEHRLDDRVEELGCELAVKCVPKQMVPLAR